MLLQPPCNSSKSLNLQLKFYKFNLIPNGSSSYYVGLERPFRANLVPWYMELSGGEILPPTDIRSIA